MNPPSNAVLETMSSHRTIRKYRAEALDDAIVHRAVSAAQMAATSSNVQAYSLLRVSDPRTRARIAELCGGQSQVERAGAFFVISADQRRHRLMARAAGRPYEPNLETFLIAVIDASLFAQNLVLAFESLGLGTCYIGGLRLSLPAIDELLELPGDVLPLFGLAAGVPDEDPSLRPRLPLEAVLFEDRYPDDDTMLATIAAYDEAMARYYEERGQPGYDWSGGTVRRFAKREREDLLEYYRGKGAVLE